MRGEAGSSIGRQESVKKERLEIADFLICHDEKVCEIKHGQEQTVAKNFQELEQGLTGEQKLIVFESLLEKKLFTDEKAFEILSKLEPWQKLK